MSKYLFALGSLTITAGVLLLSIPAAVITAGVLLTAWGVLTHETDEGGL